MITFVTIQLHVIKAKVHNDYTCISNKEFINAIVLIVCDQTSCMFYFFIIKK